MSTWGIKYTPLANDQKIDLHGISPGTVESALRRAFGDFPIEIQSTDYDRLNKLDGMAATCGKDDNPYKEISDLVYQFGAIRLETY